MREVICIHIGQGGVQVGDTIWEQFCLEHDIQPNGESCKDEIMYKKAGADADDSFTRIFSESSNSNLVPRALFLDLEPTAIDELRTGARRSLYEPSQLVSGKQDTASVFAAGRYTAGKEIIDTAMDRIRTLADDCCYLQSFLIFNTAGGGTGSGLGSLLLERLSTEYGKTVKIGFPIYPSSKLSYSPTEPYNALLASHFLIEHQESTHLFENEALYRICQKKLELQTPTLTNLNKLISNVVSCGTSSLRFDGYYGDMTEYVGGLIPYPRLHFNISSFFPFCPDKANLSHSFEEITHGAYDPENFVVTCNPRYGKYMSSTIIYRGDFALKDPGLLSLKATNTVKFVYWNPTGFRVGIERRPVACLHGDVLGKGGRSACTCSNSTAIREVFEGYAEGFDKMFGKRAFVH